MSMTDPAFESNVISLLKGIYDNVGSSVPYKTITGNFRQLDDGGGGVSTDLNVLYNNTPYTVEGMSYQPGLIGIRVNGFDANVYEWRSSQLFLGQALFESCSLSSYLLFEGDPWIEAYIQSNSTISHALDIKGLGSLSEPPGLSFEIRFYPVAV